MRKDSPRGTHGVPTDTLREVSQADTDSRDEGERRWLVDAQDAPLRNMGFNDRYVMDRSLGEGGMGEVLLFQDRQIGRRVAMKVLHGGPEAPRRSQARFLREARVQGQLEHPSIVPVYDLGMEPTGAIYFTMKRIRGKTLEDIVADLRDDPPGTGSGYSRRKLLTAFGNVCLAVDFAHQHGVLHRDLKPANVMLGDFGEVYVLDWGLARIGGEAAETAQKETLIEIEAPIMANTMTGAILGTPGYMAPEQMRGEVRSVGPKADVYSLGAILFELLTSEELHPRTSPAAIVTSTLGGAEARPSIRCPKLRIPPDLEAIVVGATAIRADERFASARQLYEALERHLDGERDEDERRKLATGHAEIAWDAAGRATKTEGAMLSHRRQAMREVGRALALDPGNALALRSMFHLMSNPPAIAPDEVEHELRGTDHEQMRRVARVAGFAYLTMLLYLPLFFWLGIHSPASIGVFYAFSLAAAFLSFATSIPQRPPMSAVWMTMVVSTLAMASTATLFGPLIVTPTLIAVNTTAFAMILDGWKRIVPIVTGIAFLGVTVVLHELGFLPGGYAFTDAGMVVLPGAVELPEVATIAFLTVTAIAAVITSSATVAGARDALRTAQRKLYLYTWHLRELLPDAARGGGRGGSRDRRMTFRASGTPPSS